jgi:plasmid stabilization system protein ParE
MRFHVHPAASREAVRAYRWYLDNQPEAAERFRAALRYTLRRIQEFPLAWPLHDAERRARLRGFPYHVVYRLKENDLLVVAIAHDKRHGGYWRDR